jgi:hypothetical protein
VSKVSTLCHPTGSSRGGRSRTRGGWSLNLTLANETVNPVPNLAAAANSREALVNFEATAVTSGGNAPMTDSSFVAGYQLGCQVDVSSGVQVGGAGAIAPSASVGATFGTGGVQPGVNAGVGGGLTGYVQTNRGSSPICRWPVCRWVLKGWGCSM